MTSRTVVHAYTLSIEPERVWPLHIWRRLLEDGNNSLGSFTTTSRLRWAGLLRFFAAGNDPRASQWAGFGRY